MDDAPRDARPASPFLILLLGGASCALGAEWLRFQWGPWLAVPTAAVGGVVTLTAVARAYRARRRWRRRRARVDEAARNVPPAPGDDALMDREPAMVRASRAPRPVAGVDRAGGPRGARADALTADADGASPRSLPGAARAATRGGRSSERSERPPTGAAANEPGADRERVGAARADAGRDPERPRRDR